MARKPLHGRHRQDEAALERAQELIYDAWEAATVKRRAALARQAIEISPNCADAYVLLAGQAKRGTDEELELWRQGVAAGEAALGKAAFKELAGEFWGFLETRPYMRARLGLALALWRRGARDEAVTHLRDMLRLNPNDNQGNRYILTAYLMELGRDPEAAKLLKDYRDDASAAWTFTAALLAFRRECDTAKSRKLLAEAIESNAFVPRYLLGARKMPKRLPDYMGMGDEAEAVHFVDAFGRGWNDTPGALEWLRGYGVSSPHLDQLG